MKRRVAVGWLALAAGAALLPATVPGFARSAAGQREASEVGAGPPGDPSLRLVGRGEFGPDAVRLFGYLSGVIGLGAADVFPAGDPSEATAAFTWTAEFPAVARDARGDVTTFSGDGDLVLRHDPAGGASWADPASFARGETLAAYALSLATAVQRQSPTLGVVVGDGTLTQQRGEPFTLGGEPFRLGHPGVTLRLRFTGALTGEGAPAGQPWPAGFTGSAVVLLPASQPPAPGGATPAPESGDRAPSPAAGSACAGWAGATRDRLLAARERAAAARTTPTGDLDAAALDNEAAAVEADLASQRSGPVESADAATNRLAAAALGTYARGLRSLAASASSGDAAAAALQTLADGDGLADRALADLVARYPDCA